VAQASGRVLIAGTESNLDEVRALVASLPESARGQVFVEVATAAQIDPMATPERVTVTWLTRDTRSGDMGSGLACAPGQALGRALHAWVGEMSTGDAEIDGDEVCVWLARDLPTEYVAV
ncbi:MAG: SIP domain-containing protein, partial [Herbiconiux sp.]|nr:SIP domain-containing protein [Herbiconiux sp.]